MTSLESNKVK